MCCLLSLCVLSGLFIRVRTEVRDSIRDRVQDVLSVRVRARTSVRARFALDFIHYSPSQVKMSDLSRWLSINPLQSDEIGWPSQGGSSK